MLGAPPATWANTSRKQARASAYLALPANPVAAIASSVLHRGHLLCARLANTTRNQASTRHPLMGSLQASAFRACQVPFQLPAPASAPLRAQLVHKTHHLRPNVASAASRVATAILQRQAWRRSFAGPAPMGNFSLILGATFACHAPLAPSLAATTLGAMRRRRQGRRWHRQPRSPRYVASIRVPPSAQTHRTAVHS